MIFSKKVIDEESDTTGGRQVGWGKEITGEKQKGQRHTGLISLEGGLIYIHRPLKAFL